MQVYQPQYGANPYPQQGQGPQMQTMGMQQTMPMRQGQQGFGFPASGRAAGFKFHRGRHRQRQAKAFPVSLPVEESYIENILRLNREKRRPSI